MMWRIHFIFGNVFLPLILSIYYSKYPKKNQINYEITKGIWYLIYGSIVAVDYLCKQETKYVIGFAVSLAIMEGIPLLLKKIFNPNYS